MLKMKFMTKCKKWDIVLVPFPFTDLSSVKKRPALIISPDNQNQFTDDKVILFITSNVKGPNRFGDYFIKDIYSSGLPKPSLIRMKFATIAERIIIKKLGNLSKEDRNGLLSKLVEYFKN